MTEEPESPPDAAPATNFGRWACALIAAAAIGAWLWSMIDGPVPRTAPGPLLAVQEPTPERPADTDAMNAWVSWRSDQGTTDRRIDGYRIKVSSTLTADALVAPRFLLTDASATMTEVVGVGAGYIARAEFAVVKLDPDDTSSQVLISAFSGGAHCCSDLTMHESRNGQWRSVELGSWDGDTPSMPADLDGDGIKEFQFVDQAFLYAFASYADSWAPPLIHKVVNGQVEDVSTSPAFRAVFEAALIESREACLERSNGACAAYVAAAARIGRLDTAWEDMLGAYDQASEWTLPTACRVRTAGECPVGADLIFSTYPEALQWFLGEHGYTDKTYVEPLTASGPSFSCGSTRSASDRAICQAPNLAILDRTLAVA